MPHTLPKDLNSFLNPRTIAIIGASRDPKKIGNITIRNILKSGFKGRIYPINPKASQIQNIKVFNKLSDLPEVPDLAIISLPVHLVLDSLAEATEFGIKNFIIYTAGFKEAGEAGVKLEESLKSYITETGINVLGPNCLGFANTSLHLNATFGNASTLKGDLKFISQSGAIASALFDWAEYTNLGFSEFVTLGNKVDINENTLLEHWYHEVTTKYTPIGMYLESISDGKKFLDLASKITKTSPIFLLKPGKSEEAKHAMQSHTGSLAGEDKVLEVALKQAGVIRCEGIQDMFDMSRAFSWSTAPKGPNIAIVSNAGGPAVVSADFVANSGLNMVPISSGNKKYLSEHLPRAASLLNPVDVLGDALADRYEVAIETVLKQSNVHSVLVLLTPQVMTEIKQTAAVISKLSKKYKKTLVCAFIGGSQVSRGQQILNREHIPAFAFPERAIKAIANMWKWEESKKKPITHINNPKVDYEISMLVSFAKEHKRTALSGLEVDFILKKLHLDTPPTEEISTNDKANRFAVTHGWPVVLKLSSDAIMHKTESGALITNITNSDDLEKAFQTLSNNRNKLLPNVAKRTSIQIQKQVEAGFEVIIGVKRDDTFGYTLMFGAGGIYTDILADVNLHILPISRQEIIDLVQSSKMYAILKGARGKPPYYLKGIYDVMEKIAHLVTAIPEFSSFEINPVIVDYGRVYLVDGKATL